MGPINFLNVEYLFQKAYELIAGNNIIGLFLLLLASFLAFLEAIRPISLIISLLLIVGIVYVSIRLNHLREVEREIYHPTVTSEPAEEAANEKWQKIIEHINSDNENDWRLAILEADIILDEMVEAMGYRGDTLGEKLKGVEKSDFTTIQDAWEAHLIRNKIAHEGQEFRITQREAKRIISLYEKVFKEFRYI